MKRLLIVFLFSAYLFSTTEFIQLLKVPVLISHFVEHKSNDADMTIWDYLVHHYGGHEKDADWDTDMKLPFMQYSDVLNISIIVPNNHTTIPKKLPINFFEKYFISYKDQYIPSSYLESIWQPPKCS